MLRYMSSWSPRGLCVVPEVGWRAGGLLEEINPFIKPLLRFGPASAADTSWELAVPSPSSSLPWNPRLDRVHPRSLLQPLKD
jgi:hypothetical protein